MSSVQIDVDLLRRFEAGLDPWHPQKSAVPARVLGYGEISTVLEIGGESQRRLAYKRMPMFKTEQEARAYEDLYHDYVQILQERVGLQLVPGELAWLGDREKGRVTVYIVQERLPSGAVGHKAILGLAPDQACALVLAVLRETARVFTFNRSHRGELEVGFDGQISNWAIADFDPDVDRLEEPLRLLYFDTSTPLTRRDGVEQLDPELFLRSAPSFLVWILRLLFLQDVMNRYYDFRKVALDLLANFYKEQRPELVPGLLPVVNGFLAEELEGPSFDPLTLGEVRAYYREDAWIWRLYLAFRKIDRRLHGLLGKEYPYILPDKIRR